MSDQENPHPDNLQRPEPNGPRREVSINPIAIDASYVDASHGVGLCCPKCGCPDMRVGSTVRADGSVRRYRYCRNCGRGLPTEEISAAELADLRRRAT